MSECLLGSASTVSSPEPAPCAVQFSRRYSGGRQQQQCSSRELGAVLASVLLSRLDPLRSSASSGGDDALPSLTSPRRVAATLPRGLSFVRVTLPTFVPTMEVVTTTGAVALSGGFTASARTRCVSSARSWRWLYVSKSTANVSSLATPRCQGCCACVSPSSVHRAVSRRVVAAAPPVLWIVVSVLIIMHVARACVCVCVFAYSWLELDSYERLVSLTYLGFDPVESNNLFCLVGKVESQLNNFVGMHRAGHLKDCIE